MNRLYGAQRLFICRHFHNKYKLVKVILRQDDSNGCGKDAVSAAYNITVEAWTQQ